MKAKKGMEDDYKRFIEENDDVLGRAAVEYAERWAGMMEENIAIGKDIDDIAYQTSIEVDIDTISEMMYTYVLMALFYLWEHGEDLRKWHNKKYNYVGDGMVDPTVLLITPR